MRKSTPILLSVSVLFVVTLACAAPAPAPTQDMNSLGTAIMETMISAATQTAGASVPIGLVDTPTPTFTPELPTLTPTVTLTPTPIFTATPVVPQISVSVATNCRVGPGKVYDRIGALLVGQVSEVIGRHPTTNYWYIRNPNQTNGFCWLWGEYATVTGNTAALPVFTPPPTPTPMPDFTVDFARLETCTTNWWVDMELSNTGGIAFDSISFTLRDIDTGTVVALSSDTFPDNDGCINSSNKDTLEPGRSPNISSPVLTYNPAGHKLRATITLCSSEGLNGTCLTEVIEFKP